MSITTDELHRISNLCMLKINDTQLSKYYEHINQILGVYDSLKNFDTTKHAAQHKRGHTSVTHKLANKNEDISTQCKLKNHFFHVPKVINK